MGTQMQRQIIVAIVAATLVVAGALSLASWRGGDGESAGGPIRARNPHGWSITTAAGVAFGDGMEVLHLRGHQSLVIDSIELEGGNGLDLVGAKLAGPDRPWGFVQYVKSWPPRPTGDLKGATIIDAEGVTITPDVETDKAGWLLLVGIKPDREGHLVRDGIRVNYTVGGKHYSRLLPAQLVVCTSAKYEKNGECSFPD